MNIPVLIVAVFLCLALLAHLFVGTRETASLAPPEPDTKKAAHWVQAMCAFQMLSVDLLVVIGLLFTIALSDVLPAERTWIIALCLLFVAWGLVWMVQMIAVRKRGVSLLTLPHFVIWFVLAGVLSLGI